MKTEALLLFACFLGLAALPAVPAVIQLFITDASAVLDIPADRNDDPRFFSRRLKEIVSREQPNSLRVIQVPDSQVLSDLSAARPAGDMGRYVPSPESENRIAVLVAGLHLPSGFNWMGDLLARSDLRIPAGTTLRAIRCEGDCLLEPSATVLRWLDAQSVFVQGPNRLPPRTTARKQLTLSTGVRFERLHAPHISVQAPAHTDTLTSPDATHAWPEKGDLPALPPDVEIWRMEADDEVLPGHKVFDDDVYITADSEIACDIVCHGDLHVGARSRIRGNLKINGDLFMHSGACITGHVLCQGSVTLDSHCHVDGVITALKHLSVGPRCVMGNRQCPTSLIADTISLHAGIDVHGQVWARSEGLTNA